MNENAERWFSFAREDLQVAEVVLKEEIFNQTCFHAQQCVEKALKGALARQGRTPSRTHAIADLLELTPADWLGDLRDDLRGLDDYYNPPLATLTLFPEHCQKVCPGWQRPKRQFPWRESRWKDWRPPVSHSMH